MAVVLFHGELTVDALDKWNPFKGGFIGIDIFFVISGYLITSIILQEVAAGSFSLRGFWLRRIKRLVPALVLVVLVTLPFAGYFMPYSMVEEYVGSAWSALGFVSNFWFLFEDGYWASPAKLKPLLHTWSLGVEAQFYLVFAPLLWVVWRFYRAYMFWIIAGLSLASLLAAHILSTYYPNEVFFLLPTRFWELGAGALLARLELTHPPDTNSHNRLAKLLPTVGLLMIVLPIYFYEGELDHPPLLNLIPVVGTMLIIRFGGASGEPTTRLLTSKPFVGLGLISYSFYLWHQPLFALVRIDDGYAYGGSTADLEILTYMGLALLLAVFSYFLVEKPFRRFKLHKLKSKGARVAVAGAMTLTLAGVVVGIEAMNRWGKHLEVQVNEIAPLINSGRRASLAYCDPFYKKIELCPLGELSGITDWSDNTELDFILVADSHGFAAYSNINRWAKQYHKKGAGVILGACGALVNAYIMFHRSTFDHKKCYELRQLALAKTTKQTAVILISRWRVYPKYVRQPDAPNEKLSEPEGLQLFSEKLEETIKVFSSQGAKVYVLLTVPEQPFKTYYFYNKLIKNKGIVVSGNAISIFKEKLNSKSIKTSEHLARNKWVNERIAGISQPLGNVDVLDPTGILCGEELCPAVRHWQKPLYHEHVHMTPTGFGLLEPLFEPIFAKMGEDE